MVISVKKNSLLISVITVFVYENGLKRAKNAKNAKIKNPDEMGIF